MTSPFFEMLWPVVAVLLLLGAITCLVLKKWGFGVGLLLPAAVLGGAWAYDRTHETVINSYGILMTHSVKLLKKDAAHPEDSIYFVEVDQTEKGNLIGRVRAGDIHLVSPGNHIVLKIGKRPLSGYYVTYIASTDYGRPAPKYTFVPPASGKEFEAVFREPLPSGVTLSQVTSEHDNLSARLAFAFQTDRATFDRIRPKNLERVTFYDFSMQERGNIRREAQWWRNATKTTEIWGLNVTDGKGYERSQADHFEAEYTVMTWDDDGLVQYLYFGRGLRKDGWDPLKNM